MSVATELVLGREARWRSRSALGWDWAWAPRPPRSATSMQAVQDQAGRRLGWGMIPLLLIAKRSAKEFGMSRSRHQEQQGGKDHPSRGRALDVHDPSSRELGSSIKRTSAGKCAGSSLQENPEAESRRTILPLRKSPCNRSMGRRPTTGTA